MVNAVSGHKNPVGASVYGSIAGDAWYRAQYMLQVISFPYYPSDFLQQFMLHTQYIFSCANSTERTKNSDTTITFHPEMFSSHKFLVLSLAYPSIMLSSDGF